MLRGIGKDGHVIAEGLESDHWVALDIGKKTSSYSFTDQLVIKRKSAFVKKKLNT